MPWTRIGIDLIGPFPMCDGDQYIMHCICWATSFNYIDTLPDKKADTIAASLHKMFLLLGSPQEAIVSDNGREFVNEAFDVLLTKYGVRGVRTTPLNPKGNSRTERRHRDYNAILKTVVNHYGKSWKHGAYVGNWCLNYRPRTGTAVSPFKLLLGFQPKAPSDGATQNETGKPFEGLEFTKRNLSDGQLIQQLNSHRQWCMDIIERETKRHMEAQLLANDQAAYHVSFDLGDLVLLSRPKIGSRKKGTATRLMYQNIGPFEVVEKVSDVTYRLRKLGTDTVAPHHVKYINPYLTKSAYETKVAADTADSPANPSTTIDPSFLPAIGDFMLFTGLATDSQPFFLVKVTDYDSGSGEVVFHYLNNTSNRLKYKYVWVKDGPDGPVERQHMKQPKGFEADIQWAHRDGFCWTAVHPQTNADGSFRLNMTEIKRAMAFKFQPGM
jgi:hypothetical protein